MWTVVGLGLQALGWVAHDSAGWVGVAGYFLGLVAAAMLVWGTAHLAHEKGWSPWFGLLGLLSVIGAGLVILLWEVKRPGPPTDETRDPSDPPNA
jgi:sugar phosphate permease